MKFAVPLMIAALVVIPVTARAEGAEATVLAMAMPAVSMNTLPHKASDELKKAVAVKMDISKDLSAYINGSAEKTNEYADLYVSPQGTVHINPFFKSWGKGIKTKVLW